MKKIAKVLSCLAMIFALTGCFSDIYTRTNTNNFTECSECVNPTNITTLVSNVETMMRKVGAINGSYELTNTKDTYKIEFETIVKDKRVDWDLYAKTMYKNKEILIYFKDQKFYIIYPNNGANVIIKDDIVDLVEEAEDTLKKLNATYNEENLEDMLVGDKLTGFNFEGMKESATYVVNSNGTYTITYVENSLEWQYDISSNYLITETRCSANNFNSTLIFNYPSELSITYPMGLDFLTVDIEDVKKLLEIDSFAELIDEDLKEETKE